MSGTQRDYIRLSLDGQTCTACIDIETVASNYRQAGTFRACLALTQIAADQPFWSLLLNASEAGLAGSLVEIDLGDISGGGTNVVWQRLMLGQIDQISMDFQSGLVEIEGRDLMARLIDLPSTQAFVNQTSSQIIGSLAVAAGLEPAIQSTDTLVGQYYEIEHSRVSLNTFTRFASAYDVAAYLAQVEGFDLWVTGNTLNFAPAQSEAPAALTIDLTRLSLNTAVPTTIKSIRFDRRVALDGGAQVTVRSWNSRQRTAVQGSFPSESNGGASFTFLSPNLSDVAATARAQSLHGDIVRHRLALSVEMTGGLTLMPRDAVEVVGSRGWDGPYVIDEVTRRISAEKGFVQSFVARAK